MYQSKRTSLLVLLLLHPGELPLVHRSIEVSAERAARPSRDLRELSALRPVSRFESEERLVRDESEDRSRAARLESEDGLARSGDRSVLAPTHVLQVSSPFMLPNGISDDVAAKAAK
jgi:hypothetical protein